MPNTRSSISSSSSEAAGGAAGGGGSFGPGDKSKALDKGEEGDDKGKKE